MSWKKLSSKLVYKNRFMEVSEDKVETKFGKQLTFGVVRKKPFALIVPWDGHHLYLVRQYRYPVDSFSWEFPAGHLELGSIKETAKKELKEEAGLIAKKIKELGYFFLAPGHNSQLGYVFLATELTKGKQELEAAEEGMKVKKVTLKEFQNMIIKGFIKDGPTIAAYGIMAAKKLL